MRTIEFAPGEYYHLCHRGNHKEAIFKVKGDYERFLVTALLFQSDTPIKNFSRVMAEYKKIPLEEFIEKSNSLMSKKRLVKITAFCLMPNHFHMIVKEVEDNGISLFMQKLLNSYTKYFNTKYEQSGHLFQGPFRAIHVTDNEQLLHLSAYIHRNVLDLQDWKNTPGKYPWSTYGDYINSNRWADLIDQSIILEQFKSSNQYRKFLETSTAKEIADYTSDRFAI